LRQVLVNVVGNAVKFTSHGDIELRVSRVTDPSEGIVLQFTVRDTGIGIALEKQRSIFEAFEQADSSTTRKYGGTGLGLAISSRIVERMGGRMWVESQPGAGSSFHWTARFATGAGHESWSSTDIQGYARKADAKHIWRILVAEDHDASRQLLQKLLEIRGYWVTAVSNGNEVLRELDQYSFDLVLMDIHMPELDGLAATAEIRRREKEGKHIPIVALTAEAASGLRERYLAAGLTEYLAKPIKPQKLFELIENILRTSSVN
jgi:CheY-like chemotaxis protein